MGRDPREWGMVNQGRPSHWKTKTICGTADYLRRMQDRRICTDNIFERYFDINLMKFYLCFQQTYMKNDQIDNETKLSLFWCIPTLIRSKIRQNRKSHRGKTHKYNEENALNNCIYRTRNTIPDIQTRRWKLSCSNNNQNIFLRKFNQNSRYV